MTTRFVYGASVLLLLAAVVFGVRLVDAAQARDALRFRGEWPSFSGTYLTRHFPMGEQNGSGGTIEYVHAGRWTLTTGPDKLTYADGRACDFMEGAPPECEHHPDGLAPGPWLNRGWRSTIGGSDTGWTERPDGQLIRADLAVRRPCNLVGGGSCPDPDMLVEVRYTVWHDRHDIPVRWVHLVDGQLVESTRFTRLVVDGEVVVPAP